MSAGSYIATTLVGVALPFANAQTKPAPFLPMRGSMVLAGGGELPIGVRQAFVRLAGGGAGKLLLLVGDRKSRHDTFDGLDVASVQTVRVASKGQLTAAKTLIPLLEATGIWVCGPLPSLRGNRTFEALLQNALARGAVVGGTDLGATSLTLTPPSRNRRRIGFDILRHSIVLTRYEHDDRESELEQRLAAAPGQVGWGIPKGTAVVIHRGRRVTAIGKHPVQVRIAAHGDWPERRRTLDPALFVQRWDELPYQLDLLAWLRSARARLGPKFPSDEPKAPKVASGTLILSGGKGVVDDVFARFVECAGGKDVQFVCIPTGFEADEHETGSSYSAKQLRKRGCRNVHVLHTTTHSKTMDREFLEPLRRARGVWLDGGRTFRLIDAYQHTDVHRLLWKVLERGGVIGGSSAGSQVQGDFCMRGKPSSNEPLWWEGYETGFGFLPGVIIDAHFRQRGRHKTFPDLMRRFPQMLGIGLDERTAIVVTGHVAEVLGANEVSFFDYRGERPRTVVLGAGRRYDLGRRRPR